MQKLADAVVVSASDVANFLECRHRTWLDRCHLDAPMEKAQDTDEAKLIQEKGYAHEARFFAQVKGSVATWIEIDPALSLDQKVAATQEAIHAGVEVIYQGTLRRGQLIGHADFLVRAGQGHAGQWLYEVVDTKLSRSTKAKFLLQLCFYSDLLADVIGELPRAMHLELGDGKRESFKVSDYLYYYRALLRRFHAFLGHYPDARAVPYPAPCDHCPLCPWRERCAERRVADDHLSAVAGITVQQIHRLERAGIRRMADLAALPPTHQVEQLAQETWATLHAQARLQVRERETGQACLELLEQEPAAQRGWARLPMPNRGDLFFDMEGYPLMEGGLEYLFGLYYVDAETGQLRFKAFWAHSREEERTAFISFIEFVMARRATFPGMHIYHYAHYENTAIKRLMTMHGVCESAVDQLLREGRLVDLYKVVREGMRVSKDSYSIKAIEAFYSKSRGSDVKKATDSIVVYDRWRETGDAALLESILLYNEEDCRSTLELRDWLLTLRPQGMAWCSEGATAADKAVAVKSDKTVKHEAMLSALHERLIVHPENPALAPDIAELLDAVLDFYRRAAKPQWWAIFERREADFATLLEEPEVIAGLSDPVFAGDVDRFTVYRYRYPEQDFKVRAGEYGVDLATLKPVLVVAIDEEAKCIELGVSLSRKQPDPPQQLSISVGVPVDTTAMQAALFEFAESLLAGESRYKAILDYLRRSVPSIQGHTPGSAIVAPGKGALDATIAAVAGLESSYLFIQGPPGTGKTYTGSHVIASLLKAGRRIAVSSNSHKAINNLLEAVDRRMTESGHAYRGLKKISKAEQAIASPFIENVMSDQGIARATPVPQLVGGTAWTFSKADFRESFDYLFIDEAGQVSLANLIAMGMCAENLVLLGDQMQLGQPIQGCHPGRSGESALEYLLNGEAVIAPDKGVFLNLSYRMHPDICRFISDAVYDSQLQSAAVTASRRLLLSDAAHEALQATGIRYWPVAHEGCSQRSEEESAQIQAMVASLLREHYVDEEGVCKPFTLNNILIVAPYNMQVNLLRKTLPKGARVGTVDKFQGQEAEVVIVSMSTSSAEYLPRNVEFLFSKNRLNVAVSRAKCLSIVLFSPKLLEMPCRSPGTMALVNIFAHLMGGN